MVPNPCTYCETLSQHDNVTMLKSQKSAQKQVILWFILYILALAAFTSGKLTTA
jgi:hypothetical protein